MTRNKTSGEEERRLAWIVKREIYLLQKMTKARAGKIP